MSNHLPHLSPAEMAQQIDFSRRLLRMALFGVPQNPPGDEQAKEILALQALMTAFMAISKTSACAHQEAIDLVEGAKKSLVVQAEQDECKSGSRIQWIAI